MVSKLTEDVEQCEKLTEEVSVSPKIVIFHIGIKIVQ